MRKKDYFWGALLILIGAALALQASNLFNLSLISHFILPIALIIIAFSEFLSKGIRTTGIIFLSAGIFFFLKRLNARIHFTDFNFNFLFLAAIILVIAGISLLLQSSNIKLPARKGFPPAPTDITAIFSGRKELFLHELFEYAVLTAVFGGINYDLRQTALAPNAYISATAFFGGITIYVPKGWRAEVSGTPIFGGIANQTIHTVLSPDSPLLKVEATTVFGGIEIKYF